MLDDDKRYTATLKLGLATDTGDPEGEVIERCDVPVLDEAEIGATLDRFTGEIEQIPPMYSALKVDGKPLYRLARQGKVIERQPRRVHIHQLLLLDWSSPDIRFEVHCSKGTYVRTLGEDMARSLGSCGHLTALRRVGVGAFGTSSMVTLETLQQDAEKGDLASHLLPADAGLAHWPVVSLNDKQTLRYRHGNPVQVEQGPTGRVRVLDTDSDLLGLGEIRADGMLHPTRVFQLGGVPEVGQE